MRGTFLILMLPETGAFNATFRLARTLSDRGDRILYLVPPKFRRYVEAQGFETLVVDLYGTAHQEARARELGELATLRPDLRRKEVAHHYGSAQIAAWLEGNRADLLLLDPVLWPYSPPFLEWGIPILGLGTTLSAARSLDVPPVFSDVVPDPQWGWRTRWRSLRAWLALDRVFWQERWAYHRLRWRLWLARHPLLPDRARQVRRRGGRLLRHEYGYKLGVPDLVLAPRELDFPRVSRRLPRAYAGACVDPERCDGTFPWDWIDDEKKLAYCSLGTYAGSYGHRGRLFRAAVEVFRERPDWQLVLQAGDALGELGPRPSNVLAVARVPQLKVLERSVLAILHGGFSSLREAIYYGVPMIVFPCWYDQPGNAARVLYHHLGARGDLRTVDAAALSELVRQVTEDDSCHRAVKRLQRIFRQQADCVRGADFIDSFLAARGQFAAVSDGDASF